MFRATGAGGGNMAAHGAGATVGYAWIEDDGEKVCANTGQY
jgi:hypothetical protein